MTRRDLPNPHSSRRGALTRAEMRRTPTVEGLFDHPERRGTDGCPHRQTSDYPQKRDFDIKR